MSITAGLGSGGRSRHPALRLTLSLSELTTARLQWGEHKIAWSLRHLGDRWQVTFSPSPLGNKGMPKRLSGGGGHVRDYLTWSWGGRGDPMLHHLPRIGKPLRAVWGEQRELIVDLPLADGEKAERPAQTALAKRRSPKKERVPKKRGEVTEDSAATRLRALRVALNHAILELRELGMPVVVTQRNPGEEISALIQF